MGWGTCQWQRLLLTAAACAAWGCSFDVSAGLPASGSDAGAIDPADAGSNPGGERADGGADAAPPRPARGDVRSRPGTPTLDGQLEDWSGASFQTFDIASAAHSHLGDPSYESSASVRFASLHDRDNIYIMLIVTDDAVVNQGDPLFDDDSVSLFIDAAGDRGGPYGIDDHEIVIGSGGSYVDYGAGQAAVLTGAARATDTGWIVEIGIDKSTLISGGMPSELGFSLALNDDDGLGANATDAYGLWYQRDEPACVSCCTEWPHAEAWCDTGLFGRLLLE